MLKKRLGEDSEAGDTGIEETLEEISLRMREQSPNGHRIETFDDGSLMENIHLANEYYDRNLPGQPQSERRVLGGLFAFMKRLARKAVAWYAGPALDNQRIFNAAVTRSVNEMKRYLDHLQINEDILSTLVRRDLALFRSNILYLNRYLERRMLDFEHELKLIRGNAVPQMLPSREGITDGNDLENGSLVSSLDVLTLEQRVHGSPRAARDRQRIYLKYLRDRKNVLALGCGRGELLQLLESEKIPAKGTETNATLADYCRDHDLDVVLADSMEYLESQEDESLDGITLSRFAGHEPPARLVRMLNLCHRKLEGGGVLIIETPNPFSLYTIASYALESSGGGHPLHPETLNLLCLSCGYVDTEVIFLDPLPPEERLDDIDPAAVGAVLEPREQELFHQVNENFAKINRILFSHRDYSVVARRG